MSTAQKKITYLRLCNYKLKNMKNLLLLILAMSALCSCSSDVATTSVGADDARIVYIGRVSHTKPDTGRFTYPGTQIWARFVGKSIAMNVKPESGFYVADVDGQVQKIQVKEEGRVVIADSLSEGQHVLKLMYIIEGYEVKPEFYGLEIEGQIIDFGQLPERKMMFIGNSITCGYGVEGTAEDHFEYATENHYDTYASITARALEAQHHAIARSGIGIYRNYGDVREGSKGSMPAMFDQTLFMDSTEIWDHSSYVPDVLCLNLGTNDTSLDNYDVELLSSAYASFFARLRGYYPAAHIVLLTGSMMQGQALNDVKTALDDVCNKARLQGDTLVHRLDFTPQDGTLGYGSDWHPSRATQQQMADELTAFIKQTMSW